MNPRKNDLKLGPDSFPTTCALRKRPPDDYITQLHRPAQSKAPSDHGTASRRKQSIISNKYRRDRRRQRQRKTHKFDGAAHGFVQNTSLRAGLPVASLDATLYEARVACRVARFNKQRFGPRRCIVGGLLDRQVIAADDAGTTNMQAQSGSKNKYKL